MEWHIYPDKESDCHIVYYGSKCECGGTVYVLKNGDFAVVHNSVTHNPMSVEFINLAIKRIEQ